MSAWQESLRFFFVDGLLLVILFAAITLLVFLSQQYALGKSIQQRLAGAGAWRGAGLAAVGGAVTPFCSCSTVPVLNGMLRANLRLAACFSFLIASPVINEGVMILLARSSGVPRALLFVVAAAGVCIVAGVAVERMGMSRFIKVAGGEVEALPGGFLGNQVARSRPRLGVALRSAWAATLIELRQLLPYLLIGIAMGAVIHGYVPSEILVGLVGMVPVYLLIPLVALIAVPLYMSPIAVVPVGFALLEKGMPPGVVIAFLIACAGTSLPEMVMLGRLFRWPLVLTHMLVVIAAASALGYAWQWMA